MIFLAQCDTKEELFVYNLLGFFGAKIFIKKPKNLVLPSKLRELQYSKRDEIQTAKYFHLGSTKKIAVFFKNFLNEIPLELLFKQEKRLVKKILLAYFITSQNFHEIGCYSIFAKQNFNQLQKIFLIHNSLTSYIFKNNAVNLKINAFHLYNPIRDLKLLVSLLLKKIKIKKYHFSKKSHITKTLRTVGFLYHLGKADAKYYPKNYFLSRRKKSILQKKNIDNFAINFFIGSKVNILKKLFFPLSFKINKILKFIFFKNRSKSFLIYKLLILKFFFETGAWQNILRKYKNLKYLILDYDIQVPFAFSFACKEENIQTFAVQARPALSFNPHFGSYCEKYAFSGPLYEKYGKRNSSLVFEKSYQIGFWKEKIFKDKNLVPLKNISKWSPANRSIQNRSKKIIFFGYFNLFQDKSPLICKAAFEKFLSYAKLTCTRFPKMRVLLRLKILDKNTEAQIKRFFLGIKNFFLIHDRKNISVSYRLIKDASMIVSVPSSIGEEAIGFGKKVIFLDDFFSVKNIASNCYPKEFAFCIAKNDHELIKKININLQNNSKNNAQYKKLQNQINFTQEKIKNSSFDQRIEKILTENI